MCRPDSYVPPSCNTLTGSATQCSIPTRTEQSARAETIKKLQARCDQIEARIGTMCMDKLDGRSTREFLDKQAATLRREQHRLLRTVVEKDTWKDGALQTALFEPFQTLLHSNQESYRKEKPKVWYGCNCKFGSPAWIRTTIHGSKGRCPTIRRPGIFRRELTALVYHSRPAARIEPLQ